MREVQAIDRYGSNAAIRCPACNEVFVFSELLNKKNGRLCPHCKRATASFTDGRFVVDAEAEIQEPVIIVKQILTQVKPLAAEFYRLTGKPLGVTGEVAEFIASEILGLNLVPARTIGYDALRGSERIQIKGRANSS